MRARVVVVVLDREMEYGGGQEVGGSGQPTVSGGQTTPRKCPMDGHFGENGRSLPLGVPPSMVGAPPSPIPCFVSRGTPVNFRVKFINPDPICSLSRFRVLYPHLTGAFSWTCEDDLELVEG